MSDLNLQLYQDIISLRSVNPRWKQYTDTIRDTFIIHLSNARMVGRNCHYPNCLVQTNTDIINPYDERVMSLQKDSFYTSAKWYYNHILTTKSYNHPVYFFVYNVDNYYHFIYDTLPILYGYFCVKETEPNLKLLIQTSHSSKPDFPSFIYEFFSSFGIQPNSLQMADMDTVYNQMYIGSSLTHGRQSNSPPSFDAYRIWNRIMYEPQSLPKRIYISRRSWIHGRTDNIGTNYTTRRKCMNEDQLVNRLKKTYGILEIFTELLSTEQKLAMFAQAEIVVGVIGGGMCNLLFSPPSTKALCIVTPDFLEINNRFKYSMDHTNIRYSYCTKHDKIKEYKYKLFTRVRIINSDCGSFNQIGEIEEYDSGKYIIRVSNNDVAGFSQDFVMQSGVYSEKDIEPLDSGLNSPYICELTQFESDLKGLLESD